jgi:hypothetical protein
MYRHIPPRQRRNTLHMVGMFMGHELRTDLPARPRDASRSRGEQAAGPINPHLAWQRAALLPPRCEAAQTPQAIHREN